MKTPDFLRSDSTNEDDRKLSGQKRRLSEEERRKRATWGAVLISIIFYVIAILAIADPREENITTKAFGSYPSLGLSHRIVGCLLFTVIYIPFPFIFLNSVKIIMKAFDDGIGLGRIGLLVYLTTVGKRHPSLPPITDCRPGRTCLFLNTLYFLVNLWVCLYPLDLDMPLS